MELLQELLITAFVALILSFFLARLLSSATAATDSKRDHGLQKSNDTVPRVLVEEKKFDGGLRVQSSTTKSKRKVRFADESVQKVEKFDAFDEKRRRSGRIRFSDVPVGSTAGQGTAAGTVGVVELVGIKEVDDVANFDKFEAFVEKRCRSGQIEVSGVAAGSREGNSTVGVDVAVVGIKEVDDVADLDGLVVEEKAVEARVEAVEEVGGEWGREAVGGGGIVVDGDKDGGGVVGDLGGLVVEGEGDEGKEGVESVNIKEEGVVTSLDGLFGKEDDDVEIVDLREEGVVTCSNGLVVEKEGSEGKKGDEVESVNIKEEGVVTSLNGKEGSDGKEGDGVERVCIKGGAVTSLDGLVVEEGGEGRDADGVERDILEGDVMTNWDGLGGKEGCEGREVDDVESAIIEGNEKEDAGDIGKRREGIKGDDIESENKEEGLVTDLDGLVDEEGIKEADDGECVVKEGNPLADLAFEAKIIEKVGGDVGDVENVIEEGNEMVENADVGCKIDDTGSAIDGIIVTQDAKVSVGESGIVERLDKEDVKQEESVGGLEDDDWEGIEKSDLGEAFAAAAKYVASGGKNEQLSKMGSDVQMQLYALHKVAVEGPCHEPQPMAIKISSRAKWNAWQRMGNMDPEVAMEQYIALLSDKVPGWIEEKSSGDNNNADSLESGIHAGAYCKISTDLHNQDHSAKKRELEDCGADGGV